MTQRKRRQLTNNIDLSKRPVFAAYSDLVTRLKVLGQLGYQYGGDRDIYQALGYVRQNELTFDKFYERYKRQDIAKAIIDRPVKASWKGTLTIIENSKEEETVFEKTWKKLYKDLHLKSAFIRADKLTGLGRYSVLLLGFNDVTRIEDFQKPVPKRTRKPLELLYVKPYSEYSAKIRTIVKDPTDPRYGRPELYEINIAVRTDTESSIESTLMVHHSRVVHLVEDILEDEVYGTPRLESVYNRLMDLEKLVGGDAEMFWRGARPGYTGEVQPEYQMTAEGLKDLEDQIDEFEHNLRRVLINEGINYKAFEQQIADPSMHVDIQFQLISAATNIPKRILTGSERGELSSAQDKQEYTAYVGTRREEQNEPMILTPFLEKLIEVGILPEVEYSIVWDDLYSTSDSEKVNMGKVRSVALKEYTVNPYTQEVVPLQLFLKHFLGFNQSVVDEIMEQGAGEISMERFITPEEAALLRTRSGRDYRTSTGENFEVGEY